MGTLKDLQEELHEAHHLLQQFVDNIQTVGGLADIRINELDDEPGWPDMQTTYEAARRFLGMPPEKASPEPCDECGELQSHAPTCYHIDCDEDDARDHGCKPVPVEEGPTP